VYNVCVDNDAKIKLAIVPRGTKHTDNAVGVDSPYLPQRIDLLLTSSAAGQVGPPILIKRIKEMEGDKIWRIPFRKFCFVTGTRQGELWIVPKGVSVEDYFQLYYDDILPAFIKSIQSALKPLV
jgi:hypothetical protein